MITSLSLSKFRSHIHDIARPNRFEVSVTPSKGFDYNNEDFVMLPWLAETAQIPARTQGEIPIKFHGMELKLPGDYSKENLTIGFLNSYGWEGRRFFENWMEFIQMVGTSNSKNYAGNVLYDSKVAVTQLGRTEDSSIISYVFYNVFPTNLSNIDLSMDTGDSYEKFTVSFAYSHYKMEKPA